LNEIPVSVIIVYLGGVNMVLWGIVLILPQRQYESVVLLVGTIAEVVRYR
jgi:hypothetical protein